MAHTSVLLSILMTSLFASTASAAIVRHTFNVGNRTVHKLCEKQVITVVNGRLPGPIIRVHEGDELIILVLNNSPYNLTIHWHGIFQIRSQWSDGPAYVTQCPILPGNSYTYRFKIIGQEGTLWWHAHFSWLRATVYGPLIIRPPRGRSYPYVKPHKEIPILLGEWFNRNVVDIEMEAQAVGVVPDESVAFTFNGQTGDLYPCSNRPKDTYKLDVVQGKTYLLRIINAALNNQLFFKIANHELTVVAIDALYTNPYETDVVVLGPGQTTDVLFTANQRMGNYYMAAHPYASGVGVPFDNTTTRGIVRYHGAKKSSVPEMPVLPAFNDTPTAFKFYSNLTGLTTGPHWIDFPREVDKHMFITIGLGISDCGANATCNSTFGPQFRLSANMNNESLRFPTTTSLLEAFYYGEQGIYTEDFPDRPAIEFDYTSNNLSSSLLYTPKGTRVTKVPFNTTVQVVLQNTALIVAESHPIHLHGFNFYVLKQGFGNYNEERDGKNFNFVNPQMRNTIAVPGGGWAVIRFRLDRPDPRIGDFGRGEHRRDFGRVAFNQIVSPNFIGLFDDPPEELGKQGLIMGEGSPDAQPSFIFGATNVLSANEVGLVHPSTVGYDSSRAADSEEAEAVAVIREMEATLGRGMKRVMVLTDCRRLVSAFEMGSTNLSWRALTLAPKMLFLAGRFHEFRFQFINRSFNFEAHALAALGACSPAFSLFEPNEASDLVNSAIFVLPSGA
ncbi:hypothetical protein GIB67_001392 [Kingdonia uniflora]|uniref:Laccase n=1 Tax=Kingdonia uniflora TaxID=39325 RepID=A0A7J7N7R3_9MAGN|nr:hypothetical protein GIB67_001392 [Kingdonia uniflora]